MTTEATHLPTPTPDLVCTYIQQFDQQQVTVEAALTKLFQYAPNNIALEDVLLKVVTLNSLYATGILATYTVAEHIHRCKVDADLQVGDPAIVHVIAKVQIGAKVRNNYSFASKYCAWHNPTVYPIYDSFVDQMLWEYQKLDRFATFRRQDLWDYPTFAQVVAQFRAHYRLTEFSLKEIDKYLWSAGQQRYPRVWS